MTGARDGTGTAFDIAVIGAGVVGSAIAREASKYQWTVALIDAADDVGTGTSKANTAILHTGFDAEPGSLEARLVRRGWELFGQLAPDLGIPIERTGAVLVAWTPDEVAELAVICDRATANGYLGTRRLDADELYAREPNLGPGAAAGVEVPDESIICTFTTPLAFATQAVINGTHLRLGSTVVGIGRSASGDHLVSFADGSLMTTRWLVNAAGLESDRIDRMLGHARFVIRPRRGELIVFDKLARGLVKRIVLPVPTSAGKGVLVAPTVFGNVILGPTAEDVTTRQDTSSTRAGITSLLARGGRIMPALVEHEVTATYAGLRAATEHKDYQIHLDSDQRYVCVGGIRSTGLTASPAIAEHVLGLMRSSGVALHPKPDFRPVRMPPLGEVQVRRYRDADAISSEPRYGSIVCHCERVTRGEIADALESPIPAQSIDGLRRRTRALLGRCQGFHCLAEVVGLVAEHTGREVDTLLAIPGSASADR